jgi:hypothetical protein
MSTTDAGSRPEAPGLTKAGCLLLFIRIMYTVYIRIIGIEGVHEQIKAYDGGSFRPDLGRLGIIAGGNTGLR